MGVTGGDIVAPPTATRELLAALSTTEKFFWACLESSQTGSVLRIREAVKYLALIRTYQTSLGIKAKNGSTVTATLLG